MRTRKLTAAEFNAIGAGLSRQMTASADTISDAADDRGINKVRALLADYDACAAVLAMLRSDRFRVVDTE